MPVRASKYLTALVASAAVSLPCLAFAADLPGIRVAYGDLNLATPAGVAVLYSRIRGAAERYCEPARIVTGTRVTPEYDRCVKVAIATTVQKVNQPGLTALHAAHSGAGDRQG
jgi:UrcA family protein